MAQSKCQWGVRLQVLPHELHQSSGGVSLLVYHLKKLKEFYQTMQQIEELRQQFLGYLVDSAFIQVHRSLIRDLNR